ncbi:MAPEG family protein [Pseudomonas asiatica]|uniref:MAPEG family protein n=1 Tax=Pseudomonas putida TaxID=303 RepID=A0A1L5PJD9_PSEPU|nr:MULTISPECIES: MAPEG family protein [Pseudomonas]APO80026.1 MAPEG family protein [Pseudomonas putida]MDV5100409.1 MAPEG family protein [Pseudomonas sp. LSJ-87]WJD70917.1 MAPEG family protein [Pseudomonas asiatica]
MTNASTIALTGLIAWALTLLVLMELLRGLLVVFKQFPANGFTPDNSNLSPFMQRLARAHANCLEGLPIFGGLLLVALVTRQTAITDPLAIALLAARLVQSLVHLVSLAVPAVFLRFTAFAVQLVIAGYWTFELLSGFVS